MPPGRPKLAKTPSTVLGEKFNKLNLAEGKENEAIFDDETHVVRSSAAENYFMQGKAATMNKARRGRRKGGQMDDDVSSDEEGDDGKKQDPTKEFSLQKLSSYIEKTCKEKAKSLAKVKKQFDYWTNVYLDSDFNICIVGAGAKNTVLELYAKELSAAGEATFVVDGYKEEATVKAILQSLADSLNIRKKPADRDASHFAAHITDFLEKKQLLVYMFLHNIDSSHLRDLSDQRALATLSSTPWIRLITSVDHMKATIMWDSECSAAFNFVYVEVNTFDFSLPNLIASKSTALGLNPKNNTSAHTMSSLDILWQSLAENAKKIFRIFFGMTFESGQSVPFWDLFNAARDDFLVSSDAALRQLLVEFEDHRVLNRRRREDGNENLIGCIDRELIEKFLAEKGLTLEL